MTPPKQRAPSGNPLSKSWNQFEFLVLDLEGTGSSKAQRIVEIAAFTIRNGKIDPRNFYCLVNPETSISPMASRIHGIFNEDVADKACLPAVAEEFCAFAKGKIIVAHNAVTERELLRINLPSFDFGCAIDTLKLSRKLYPGAKGHSLDDLIERFSLNQYLIASTFKRHRAAYDALATAHAFLAIITDRCPDGISLQGLYDLAALPFTAEASKCDAESDSQLRLF